MVVASLLAAVPSASAAARKITGKLNASGYTVIALGYNGRAAISKARSFSLRAPDSKLTLQLVNRRTGRYAGPVVVGGKGSRVIVGIKAGAKLGTIKVYAKKGYARTAKLLAKRWLDGKRFAQARKGVPIGNGRNFGFVRSKLLGGGRGRGQDFDHSGVPNAFNVAMNGDKILNNLEPAKKRTRGSAVAAQTTSTNGFNTFTSLSTFIGQGSLNANAASVTPDDIAKVMENQLGLYMDVVQGSATYLDCNGLTWCAQGGNGHLYAATSTGIDPSCAKDNSCFTAPVIQLWGPAFPQCCSANPAGLGDILNSVTGEQGPSPSFFALAPGACPQSPPTPPLDPPCPTIDQVGTGDALTQEVTDASGAVTKVPGTVGFVFTTQPGLHAWSAGSDSVPAVQYPVKPGDPGTQTNAWPISLPGSGDLVLSLTFWRPQRSPIPADPNGGGDACAAASPPCDWIDVGHLTYYAPPFLDKGGPKPVSCPQSAYTTTDPNLVPATGFTGAGGGLTDMASDMPSSASNMLTFSEDLTACFATGGITLKPGDVIKVPLFAKDVGGDQVSTGFTLQIRQATTTQPALPQFIYWANNAGGSGTTIGQEKLDGSAANQSFIGGANSPTGVAVDAQHVYWANAGFNSIARQDSSGANQNFITGANAPAGVAVDGQHIYWANKGGNTIGRANLDGTGADQSFITGANAPWGVAVDGQHVYWANSGGTTIGRANLDGTGADQSFITGASGPTGLAVDGQHVYWANNPGPGANTIGRASLDGSGANQSFIMGVGNPYGVAVDSQHIYWADAGGNTIGRAGLDGSDFNASFITGASGPLGVAVG